MTEVPALDREILNTAVLTVGDVSADILSTLQQKGVETTALAPGSRIKKFIPYAAGNFAGIFGSRADGLKLIINAHVILMDVKHAAELSRVLAEAGCASATDAPGGQVCLTTGEPFPGVFVENEQFELTGLLHYVLARLEHFKRAGEIMNRPREMHVGGEYTLDILRPKLRTLHKLYITNENGVLTGTHVTENDSQPMQELAYDGEYLTWNAYSGTTSSELFRYRLEVFDDILLGATWRIDGGHGSPFKSPVVVERISK